MMEWGFIVDRTQLRGSLRALVTLAVVAAAMFGALSRAAGAATTPLDYQSAAVHAQGHALPVQVPSGYRIELLTTALRAPRLLTFAGGWCAVHRLAFRQRLSVGAALHLPGHTREAERLSPLGGLSR